MCYKDMTFCDFYKECQKGDSCKSALTEGVQQAAEKAFLPIAHFRSYPECFRTRNES